MTKFIIIRHGFSESNKDKKFTGQRDVSLSEEGFLQAESVSKYVYENFKVDSIYASDLKRAVDTVKPLSEKLGLPVNRCKEFREIDVGAWQGMLIEDIKVKFKKELESYKQNPGEYKFIDGESFEDLRKRAEKALKDIADKNDGKTVVIGTHGGVIRTLLPVWYSMPLVKMKEFSTVPNASVTIVEYENGNYKVKEIGYCDFLDVKITEEGVK